MKRFLTAALVFSFAACDLTDENGDGIADGVVKPDTVSQVAPSTPVGTVSGYTTNTAGAALDGVNVTLVLGDDATPYSTTSKSDGSFSFLNIPAGGSGTLRFERSGYSVGVTSVAVPAAAGNIPVNKANGNVGRIALAPLTSQATFRVFTADGAPATGARATFDMPAAAWQFAGNGSSPTSIGRHTFTADIDGSGLATFTGLPDLLGVWAHAAGSRNALIVSALDANGDGTPEFRGLVTAYTAGALVINPNQINDDNGNRLVLPHWNDTFGLSIVGTNAASLTDSNYLPYANSVGLSEPVYVLFNQPVAAAGEAQLVTVVQEDCETPVAVTVTQTSPFSISIAPQGQWQSGAEYNFAVRVTGLDTGTQSTFVGFIFALDASAPKAADAVTFVAWKPAVPHGVMETNNDRYVPGAGDELTLNFDVPVSTMSGANAVVQIGRDITGNGTTDNQGEYGSGGVTEPGLAFAGFPISPFEPTVALRPSDSSFTCKASGYTSRWLVQGVILTLPSESPANSLGTSTAMRVVVPPHANAGGGAYETSSGVPLKGTGFNTPYIREATSLQIQRVPRSE